MERFVFVAAVTIAIIFGVGAVFGSQHFSWNFDVDADEPRGSAAIVELAAGRMEPTTFVAERLRIRHTAANITIIPEDRTDFSVEIDNPGQAPMPAVEVSEGRVVIDGQLRGRIGSCDEGVVELRGYSDVPSANLPRITIRTPRTLVASIGDAGTTTIGATQALEVDFQGCGDATIADVTEHLNIDMSGSGDIRAANAGSAEVGLNGSGDIQVGTVSGDAEVDINGSGGVSLAAVNGALDMENSGSGSMSVLGGNITTASIELRGSGEARVAAPVADLNVNIYGSGDVDVEGAVGEVDAEIYGSGDVSVASVTGSTRKSVYGSGDVRVGR